MAKSTRSNIAVGTIVALAAFGLITSVQAKATCKIDDELLPKNLKYTEQQLNFDLDDTPGHAIRTFEVVRSYPDEKPNCEGLKRTQFISHASADYVNGNGTLHGYATITYDNGDKIFQEFNGVAQTILNQNGSYKGLNSIIFRFTGGTGQYQRVHGLVRETINFDLAVGGVNQGRDEGEYWIEK